MALGGERSLGQIDLNQIQQFAQQTVTASSTLSQVLDMLRQDATAVAGYSQLLSDLAATVKDQNTANQARTQGTQIWQQGQQAVLPGLTSVDQATQGVSQLAQGRLSELQRQWNTAHSTPQSNFSDILLKDLTSYHDSLAQTVAAAHTTLDKAPPPPPPNPVDVVSWLTSSSTSLGTLSKTITTGVAYLTTTLPWSNVQDAVTAATTLAQTRLATVQAIETAIALPPTDPAVLASLLSQLSDLRLSIYPDPISPSDRSVYQQRMVEFDQTLTQLLAAASIGAGTPAPTIAMLPVRLETRAFPGTAGGTEFRIRVYIDDIHVNAHDPRLTQEESDWSAHARSELTNNPGTATATWAQLASHFGPARAAYLLNPDQSAGLRDTVWGRPAIASALPDRWLAIGYGPDGLPLNAALGAQITGPLHVGPDPSLSLTPPPPPVPPPPPPPPTPTDDLTVDPGLRWMIDFDEAVRKGMGIRLAVDGGAVGPADALGGPGPPTLSRLFVVGVKSGDGTNELRDLLKAHRYSNGLELIRHSTPTNNTTDAPAGFSSSDPGFERSYRQEIGDAAALVKNGFNRPAPSGDAARLAAALGLHSAGSGWPGVDSSVFSAAGDVIVEQADQQAMTALGWPATWGTFLNGLTGMPGPRAELLRSWAVAWLRPGGPLPSLRVRARPYGILPVVGLAQWADPLDPAATDVHGVVRNLLPNWVSSYGSAVTPLDFDALLARRPVSVDARARFAGSLSGWLQPGHGLLWVQAAEIDANLRDLPTELNWLGQAAGLAKPLPWPSGFMTLPNAINDTNSWPLTKPDWSLPLVSDASSGHPDDADSLSALFGQHVVYRGADNLPHELWWSAGSGWQVGALSATAAAAPAAGDPFGYEYEGAQHVVYRGTDNLVHELWWSAAGGWQVGTLSATPGAAAAAGDPFGYVEAGAQHVVYRGTDSLIHELWWSASGGWQVGTLSATSGAPAAAGDPFGYMDGGTQHVIYRGTDNLVHELWWSAGGDWQIGALSATPGAPAAAGDPCGYMDGGTQHVVYRGTDNLVHELWWTATGGWQVGALSATPGAAAAAGDPYGYMDAGNQHVVYRGTDNLVHELWWSPAGAWQVGALSATPGAVTAAGEPWGYMVSGTAHLLYRGTDNLVHELWWSGASGWQVGTLNATPGAPATVGDPTGYVLFGQTLLDLVAIQGWNATPGAGGATGTFGPRGNLINDPAQPDPTPSPQAEFRGALSYLSARHDANFAQLFGGALDITSHRIDAWATALATARLAQLRTAEKTANTAPVTLIGGFGWVENLKMRPALSAASPAVEDEPGALDDPYNSGFLLAPSLQQATTAAVLHSGFLTNNPPGAMAGSTAPFAIDLSSRRARLAGWILDGMRQGQALSALLGYRFERALREANLGEWIEPFRRAAPADPAAPPNGGANLPHESVRATDVVDGVKLLRLFQAIQALPAPPDQMWKIAQGPLMELEETADAIGDAVVAQAVHDSLTGSTHAAAASFDALATGVVPAPELRFLSTPRTGIGIAHRILAPAPTGVPYPPAGWPDTPRGRAEPALSAWVATLLGDPSQATAAVSPLDPAGAPLAGLPVPITLAQLGLGPLDVIALARHPSELELLAVHTVLAGRAQTDPPSSGGVLVDHPTGAVRPLSAVMAVARSASQLLGAGRAADSRDLAPAGTQKDPGVDIGELASRVGGLMTALAAGATALGAALPGDPAPSTRQPFPSGVPAGADPAILASALVAAVKLGIPHAAPAGTGPAFLSALVGQARAAWSEIDRRQKAIPAMIPTPPPPPNPPGVITPVHVDNAAALAALLSQLTTGFGESFRALPHILNTDLAHAASLTQIASTDPGQGPEAWLVKAGRVHPGIADLLDTCCAAEALGGPQLGLTVAQLPLPNAPVPWVGLPFGATPPRANTLSLTMVGPAAPPAGTLAALLVADWVEVIPSAREIAGLAYHYDAPTSQAPQSILLAVPARPEPTAWSYNDLIETVAAALDLAHARAIEFNDLPWQLRLVLPAAYFANGPDALPALPFAPPLNYLKQESGPITLTSVDPATLRQSESGSVVVRGTNFTSLSSNAFSVDGGGVTVTNVVLTDSMATLTVAVTADAPLGQRGVRAGSLDLPSAPVIVTPIPQALHCDTSRLSQGMADIDVTVTVTGNLLLGATATLTGDSPDVAQTVSCMVVSTTETQVLIDVSIAASNWDYLDLAYSPSPYVKPNPNRAPRHVNVPAILTVTPENGNPREFPMTLDELK
jgi:hypothetical protein